MLMKPRRIFGLRCISAIWRKRNRLTAKDNRSKMPFFKRKRSLFAWTQQFFAVSKDGDRARGDQDF